MITKDIIWVIAEEDDARGSLARILIKLYDMFPEEVSKLLEEHTKEYES